MRILPCWGARAPQGSRVGACLLPILLLAVSCSTGSNGQANGAPDGGGSDSSGGGTTDALLDVSEDGAVADGPATDAATDLPNGACAAPVRVVQPPVTGSGPASLGMADSDGNGLRDIDEWGKAAYMALDTDYDGEPDYQDFDDDGDGILDIYDPARLEALTPGTSPRTVTSTFRR